MNREALIEKYRQLGPWFHQIDVGEGVLARSVAALPGPQPLDHPLPYWNKIKDMLPADMSGMRIFDIGCSDGFFSVEMTRRGWREAHPEHGCRQPLDPATQMAQDAPAS